MTNVLTSIKDHEGFRRVPYPDPILGWKKPTFGYGFTYITRAESDVIITGRIDSIRSKLSKRIKFFNQLRLPAQNILVEMAYQMGVSGLLGFHDMLLSLSRGDYAAAADHGLDSVWAREQTSSRAHDLMDELRSLSE